MSALGRRREAPGRAAEVGRPEMSGARRSFEGTPGPLPEAGRGARREVVREAGDVSLGELGRGMIRGRRLLAMSGLAGAGLAGAWLALVPALYRSGAEIRIDPRPLQLPRQDARSKQGHENRMAIAFLESQVRILRSTDVLSAVIDDLGLDRDREFTAGDAPAPERALDGLVRLMGGASPAEPGRPSPGACPPGACPDRARRTALDALRRAVTVRRTPGSYVIEVQARSESPDKAARIADAVTAAYLREIRRSDAERQKAASRQIAASLPALEAAVGSDGDRIDGARRRLRVVAGSQGLVDEQQLSEVTRRLAEARAEVRTLQVRSEALAALARSGAGLDGEAFPDYPALEALRLQQASLAAQDGGLAAKFGPRHPDTVRLAEQRNRVRGLLRRELARTAESVRNDHARARAAEEDLARTAADLERRALATSAALVELRRLARVEAADGAALEASRRRAVELDEGSAVGLENVRLLGPAEVPRGPTMSRAILVALAALSGATAGAAWLAVRVPSGGPRTGGTAA